jgi:hypothetical protein
MLQLGMQLPRFRLAWAVDAEQAFSAQWKDGSGEELDLTGITVRITIDPYGTPVQFDATNTVGGFSNWTIAEEDSLLAYVGKQCRLDFVISGTPYLQAFGEVVHA